MTPEIVEARYLAAAKSPEELPPPIRREIAFAGRSNSGKSTLLNELMKRRNLARTSATPGCTRAIVFFEVRTKDDRWSTLVDLPGYGYASRSKIERRSWASLIESYLLRRPVLSTVALLVDVRRGMQQEERDLLKLLSEPVTHRPPLRVVVVGTKLDRLPRAQRSPALARLNLEGCSVVGFSNELVETMPAVWDRLNR